MRSRTSKNRGWLRMTTAMGVIPLLLTQATTNLICAPRTSKFGSANYRKMVWEQPPAFLDEEKKVTVVLAEGGAVQGGAGAMLLSWLALAPAKIDSDSARDSTIFWATSIGASVGGAVLGYWVHVGGNGVHAGGGHPCGLGPVHDRLFPADATATRVGAPEVLSTLLIGRSRGVWCRTSFFKFL